jgi:HSF-type DNA-binding
MASNIETEAIRMAEQKFPVKLHAMLTSLEAEGGAQVASWMPHGCSFKVHNQEKFMAEVLPKWFKLTKHTSFIR